MQSAGEPSEWKSCPRSLVVPNQPHNGGSALSYHHKEGFYLFNDEIVPFLGHFGRHPVFKIYRKQTESLQAPLMASWQASQQGGKGSHRAWMPPTVTFPHLGCI